MTSIFAYLDSLFSSSSALIIISISFILKTIILSIIITRGLKNSDTKRPLLFLCGLLIGSMAGDFTWVYSLVRALWFPDSDYRPYLFVLRIAWGFSIVQDLSYSLFLESLIAQSSRLNIRQKILTAISACFFCFSTYIAFTDFNCFRTEDRPPIEFFVRDIQMYYMLFILILPSLVIVIQQLLKKKFPAILEKQLRILLPSIFIPLWISDVIQVFPIAFNPLMVTNSYFAMCVSTILITVAAAYCIRRMLSLRFL
ncbi:MAG: hypothetical protein ACHQVS_04845, partial [Candidatus Babeliales bacterium]